MIKFYVLILLAVHVFTGSVLLSASETKKDGDNKIEQVSCEGKNCEWGSKCQIKDGKAVCVCPSDCDQKYQPVCGSDGRTYPNACTLEASRCEQKKWIRLAYRDECLEDTSKDSKGECPTKVDKFGFPNLPTLRAGRKKANQVSA